MWSSDVERGDLVHIHMNVRAPTGNMTGFGAHGWEMGVKHIDGH